MIRDEDGGNWIKPEEDKGTVASVEAARDLHERYGHISCDTLRTLPNFPKIPRAQNPSAKNFWRLEACVAAPVRLIIFTSSRASFSAAWIFLCPPALFSPCTLPPVPSASGAALPRSFPYASHVLYFLPLPSCSCPEFLYYYVTSLIFIA